MTTTIQRNDSARGRTYTINANGKEYKLPSVTTILNVIGKPALVPWAKKVSLEKMRAELYGYVDDPLFGGQRTIERSQVDQIIAAASKRPDEVRDAAGDFGTAAHGLIERILLGESVTPTPSFEAVVQNFLHWYEGSGLQITASEKMVYSIAHGYAGTMDATATRGGQLVVLDWKTGNALYPEARLQVAAYAMALDEMIGTRHREAIIVRFAKDAPKKPEDAFEAYRLESDELAAAQGAWLSTVRLWTWLKGQG